MNSEYDDRYTEFSHPQAVELGTQIQLHIPTIADEPNVKLQCGHPEAMLTPPLNYCGQVLAGTVAFTAFARCLCLNFISSRGKQRLTIG